MTKRRVYMFKDNDPDSNSMSLVNMSDVREGDWFRLEEPDGTLVCVAIATEDAHPSKEDPSVLQVFATPREDYHA